MTTERLLLVRLSRLVRQEPLERNHGRHALAERPERTRSLRRLPQHTISNVLIPLSQAIDLAEGRTPGHAQRVAFISMAIAETLGLDKESQLAACYAGLLHDIGVVAAGADIAGSTSGDERLVFASLPLLTPDEALGGRRRSLPTPTSTASPATSTTARGRRSSSACPKRCRAQSLPTMRPGTAKATRTACRVRRHRSSGVSSGWPTTPRR